MRQLVGQLCAKCHNRIGSELDARFCSTCEQPQHNTCSVSAPVEVGDVCPHCGCHLATPLVPRVPPPTAAEVEEARWQEYMRLLKYAAPALFVFGTVIALIAYLDGSEEWLKILFRTIVISGGLVIARQMLPKSHPSQQR